VERRPRENQKAYTRFGNRRRDTPKKRFGRNKNTQPRARGVIIIDADDKTSCHDNFIIPRLYVTAILCTQCYYDHTSSRRFV